MQDGCIICDISVTVDGGIFDENGFEGAGDFIETW